MTIRVYSKPGCGKCEAAKSKLKMMGFGYEEHNLQYHVEHHDGWREDNSVSVMAAHTLLDTMPLIEVGEEYHDYSSAMRKLKKMKKMQKEEEVAVAN
ncbi:MAG: glutaredoxin [Planctomycetes bacterium]|nr:glutaredoxin [Planctomycetota bacterium]